VPERPGRSTVPQERPRFRNGPGALPRSMGAERRLRFLVPLPLPLARRTEAEAYGAQVGLVADW